MENNPILTSLNEVVDALRIRTCMKNFYLIDDLFARFNVIYGGTWLFHKDRFIPMKEEWLEVLSRFQQLTVNTAITQSIKKFDYPPSLKQFYDLCISIENNKDTIDEDKV